MPNRRTSQSKIHVAFGKPRLTPLDGDTESAELRRMLQISDQSLKFELISLMYTALCYMYSVNLLRRVAVLSRVYKNLKKWVKRQILTTCI